MSGTSVRREQASPVDKSHRIPVHNAEPAVALCRNQRKMRYLLRISGIPVALEPMEKLSGQRLYRISLFGHHPLSSFRAPERTQWLHHSLGTPRFEPVELQTDDSEAMLVTHLAVRSVYALGLEYGEVTVAVQSPRRAKVVEVQPAWTEGDDSRLDQAWKVFRWLETEQSGAMLRLGADPEFALRDADGRMVLASDYVGKNGTVGYDSSRYREELDPNQHPLVELRPEPAHDPDELAASIYQALKLAREKINDDSVEWLAGGMPFAGYPIGGHIHFSGVTLDFSLLRKLDAYLSLPLVLVEDEGCRRRKPRYGFLGDFRMKSHGGFEYRTPPSWLVSPLVTRGVLHLAKLVATHHRQLKASAHLQYRLLCSYYRGEKETLVPHVRSVWKELSQMRDYPSPILDPYFDYLLSGNCWPADEDLRRAWQLREPVARGSTSRSNRAIMNK
jgi:hypothetical protein